jgi:hypothetical protein
VSRWGHLVFDAPLEPPRRIELLPYGLSGGQHLAGSSGVEATASAGLDVRVGVGTASTVSASINPDFAQVEQDPAVLNLTVFETFFPEKRPFFLEDSRTFIPSNTQLFQLFHSRRIGRRPDRIAVPTGLTVLDRPDQTTLLGASKFTGKASGWTYGAMTALTAREYATVQSGADQLIEPLTSYNVARVQRDVRRGSSNVGLLTTATIRERVADAFSGGADYNIRWDRNRGYWEGTWAVTRAPGTDGTRSGLGGMTTIGMTRKHYNLRGLFDHLGRNFRVNDVGFLRNRVNRTQVGGSFGLEQPDPWKRFRRIVTSLYVNQGWNDDELVFLRQVGDNTFLQFRNFWQIEAGILRDFRVLDDLDTRGGPPIVSPAETSGFLFLGSDSRKSWRLSIGTNLRADAEDSWNRSLTSTLALQPSPRLQTSLTGRYERGHDTAQWIVSRDVTGDGAVDNVYGTLDRDLIDLTVRSTYAINRDLTFQAYLQPFVAVGDYTSIRRLARPRSFEFEPVTYAANPDFNRKSLRGTVVLRWEYLPGSTLFVVWNTATSDTTRPGEFSPLRDLRSAFGADGTQAFMVKVSYWLSR